MIPARADSFYWAPHILEAGSTNSDAMTFSKSTFTAVLRDLPTIYGDGKQSIPGDPYVYGSHSRSLPPQLLSNLKSLSQDNEKNNTKHLMSQQSSKETEKKTAKFFCSKPTKIPELNSPPKVITIDLDSDSDDVPELPNTSQEVEKRGLDKAKKIAMARRLIALNEDDEEGYEY